MNLIDSLFIPSVVFLYCCLAFFFFLHWIFVAFHSTGIVVKVTIGRLLLFLSLIIACAKVEWEQWRCMVVCWRGVLVN